MDNNQRFANNDLPAACEAVVASQRTDQQVGAARAVVLETEVEGRRVAGRLELEGSDVRTVAIAVAGRWVIVGAGEAGAALPVSKREVTAVVNGGT